MRALLIQDLFTNVIALRYVSISRFVLKAWFRHRSSAQRYSVRVGIQLEVGNLSASYGSHTSFKTNPQYLRLHTCAI